MRAASMNVNDGRVHLHASIRIPGGTEQVDLTEEQAEEYRRDPDGYAGSCYGLTRDEYREWIDLDGTAYCGERTKTGKLCGNVVSKGQLSAHHWRDQHRSVCCTTHGGS